ncbi:MAG: hypothetical protein WC229_01415 [Candidatus Paceibacterota bacterium]|jgi:endonuclease/exonuclease/phosphatase family metal-dependent hydrolase
MKIKIAHLNIERDKHLELVHNFFDLHKPDVFCLCEIIESNAINFAKEFGYNFVYSPLINTEKGTQGSAIFSKVPILASSILRYDDQDGSVLPFVTFDSINKDKNRPKAMFTYHYAILTAEIENDKKEKVIVSTTHFPVADHSTPGLDDHVLDEMSDIREINKSRIFFDRFLSIIKTLPRPLIFTADMNNSRGEYIYDTLAHELLDLTPSGIVSTIDSKIHRCRDLSLVVDTVMVSSEINVGEVKIFDGVSDHKALVAELDI